jgi:hypothetical protein
MNILRKDIRIVRKRKERGVYIIAARIERTGDTHYYYAHRGVKKWWLSRSSLNNAFGTAKTLNEAENKVEDVVYAFYNGRRGIRMRSALEEKLREGSVELILSYWKYIDTRPNDLWHLLHGMCLVSGDYELYYELDLLREIAYDAL